MRNETSNIKIENTNGKLGYCTHDGKNLWALNCDYDQAQDSINSAEVKIWAKGAKKEPEEIKVENEAFVLKNTGLLTILEIN